MAKKCCKGKKNKQDFQSRRFDPILVWIGVITLTLFVGVIYLGSKVSGIDAITLDERVELVTDSTRYDWGTADINGGMLTNTFTINNQGDNILKLYDIRTSCACTTAQLITDTRTSRKFGMHETGISVFEVNPGEQVQVLVEFDPLFHGPSGVGPVTRLVSMKTNAPNSPELLYELTADIISL